MRISSSEGSGSREVGSVRPARSGRGAKTSICCRERDPSLALFNGMTTRDPGFDSCLAIERAARELITHYGALEAARIAREHAGAGSGSTPDIWRDVCCGDRADHVGL
jgi:hypothetical protein